MMTCRQSAETTLLGPIAKQSVALFAGALLDGRFRTLLPSGRQDGVRNAETIAKRGHRFSLVPCFGTEPVIDGRGLNPASTRPGSEQQQSQAIRPA